MSCTSECGWKQISVITILEVVLNVVVAVLWGTGVVARFIKSFIDPLHCNNDCFTEILSELDRLKLISCILYGLIAASAVISLVGLQSGFYLLQLPFLLMTSVRLFVNIFICERMIVIHFDQTTFFVNRIFLYTSTIYNVTSYICSFKQFLDAHKYSKRVQNGEEEREIRPLTPLFSRFLGSPTADEEARLGDGFEDVVDGNSHARDYRPIEGENPSGAVPDSNSGDPVLVNQEKLDNSIDDDLVPILQATDDGETEEAEQLLENQEQGQPLNERKATPGKKRKASDANDDLTNEGDDEREKLWDKSM